MRGKTVQPPTNDLSAALKEKDEYISTLEAQIEGYIARNSHTQSRLLSTLDTLDALRSAHASEIESLTRTKNKLSEKLDRYIDVVNVAEDEREDMKDAVNRLVEKVAVSNDYSLWPHSRIGLTSLADPIIPMHDKDYEHESRVPNDIDEQTIVYASAMIDSLRRERDVERRAHEKTRDEAECQITMLKAQLARRDAELESCVAHPEHRSKTQVDVSRRTHRQLSKTTHGSGRRMSQEEAITMLEMASVKNKALEIEVKGLAERLHKARMTAESLPNSKNGRSSVEHTDPVPSNNIPPGSPHASRKVGPPVACPNHGPSRDLSEPFPVVLSQDQSFSQSNEQHPQLADHDVVGGNTPSVDPRPPQVLIDLDNQIDHLAFNIDAFKAERDLLSEVLAEERQRNLDQVNIVSGEEVELDRILLIEEECIRLTKTEKALQERFDAFKVASEARERALRNEIDSLKHHGERYSQDGDGSVIHHLGDADNGEESMELATPLQPTLILPVIPPMEHSDRSDVDTPSIALLPLHQGRGALMPRSLSAPTLGSSRPAQERNQFERVQSKLAQERECLEDREIAVAQLRQLAEEIQWRITEGRDGRVVAQSDERNLPPHT